MITLISQRTIEGKHQKMDALEQNYIKYFEKFGVKLIPVPNSAENLDFYFNLPVKLIILSGGGDVSSNLNSKRDQIEKKLLEFAIEKKIPVLGICRGMQFINVYFGGKLTQIKNHVAINHKINISDETLKKLIGKEIEVNSYHDYGLAEKDLSPQLNIFAKDSQDSTIEGIYNPSLPIVGIMWHPEREGPGGATNEVLIKSFLNKELFWKK